MIDFNILKRVVMHADDVIALNEVGSDHGIVDSHRVIASHWKESEINFFIISDQLHVIMQRCITGVIKVTGRRFNQETKRVAAIGSVGQTAGMNGVDAFYFSEIKKP